MKKNIVITILIVLVLGLGCFIVYDKVLNKEEKKENDVVEQTDEKLKEKDFDLAEAKQLVDKYYEGQMFNFFKTEDVETVKSHIATRHLIVSDVKSINVQNLNDFECSEDIANKTYSSYHCKFLKSDSWPYSDYFTDSVTYNVINSVYKKLYGNDQNISKESIVLDSVGCCTYTYIDEIDSFVKTCEYGCGGSSVGADIYGVKSAKVSGNKLIVSVGYGTYGPFAGDGKIVLILGNQEEILTTKEDGTIDIDEVLNKYLDKMDTYEFEFLYEDGIYKLRNVVKK